MARVFYLGAPSRVNLPPDASPAQALAETGGNTGNLLIGQAIKRQLRAESIVSRGMLGPRYISENFDYIVLGASNFLHEKFDFGFWADFLERVKLPCTIIGLGAQAPQYGSRVQVAPGTLRLLKMISERSKTLGVRGPWTASVLADLGIENVRVIGCPAMYWTCEPQMALRPRSANRPLAIALNGAAAGAEHAGDVAAAKAVEAQLARWSLERNYPYILQNEGPLMEIALGHHNRHDPQMLRALMQQYGLADLTPESFVQFVKQNARVYFKVAQWHAALQQFDFVLGTRFHGCLLALLAGVPAFIFTVDARTLELCELLQIPHRKLGAEGPVELEAIYDSLDLEAVERAYSGLYQNYREFLEENGIEHRLATDGPAAQVLKAGPAAEGGRLSSVDCRPSPVPTGR